MQAAWLKDKGVRNTRETSLASGTQPSRPSAQPTSPSRCTAYGYASAEYGIERYFRNARAPIIYEGTTQVHKMMQVDTLSGTATSDGRDGDISPSLVGPALLAR